MPRRKKRKNKTSGCIIIFLLAVIAALLAYILFYKPPNKELSNLKNWKLKSFKKIKPVKEKRINKIERIVYLYFVTETSSERLKLVRVKRKLTVSNDKLLKTTIQLLIKGPTQEEAKKGIFSVFPAGVKLRDVWIKNKTAYIDFSPEIEIGVGIPVLQARIYQIVYTATQFPSVERVRILINGKMKETFSYEGLDISKPFTRPDKEPVF